MDDAQCRPGTVLRDGVPDAADEWGHCHWYPATAAHGVEYLLTWNMRHIANAELRPAIEAACRAAGYAPPVIATPDELMGGT